MNKIIQIKDSTINFLLPTGSLRRQSFQYVYRMLRNKENRQQLKQKRKELNRK